MITTLVFSRGMYLVPSLYLEGIKCIFYVISENSEVRVVDFWTIKLRGSVGSNTISTFTIKLDEYMGNSGALSTGPTLYGPNDLMQDS